MVSIRTIPAHRLDAPLVAAWSELLSRDDACDSPYFRPEFTRAVAAVREDVEVAILEEQGAAVGFFPFQRGRWGFGRPVGGRLSDFHGIIVRDGVQWSPSELIRACGLSAWDFDHLVPRPEFATHITRLAPSAYMDLSKGFDAYFRGRRRSGDDEVAQAGRKARKIARDIAPLRLVPHAQDEAVLATLKRWKSEQYRRTGLTDVFAFGWANDLLDRILEEQHDPFRGLLSALFAGDTLIAIHLGIRAHGVLHSWFPAFNRDFARYSPGLLLFMELARAAEGLGIHRIELGKGDETYKCNLMSGARTVAEGSVAGRPLPRLVRHAWRRTKRWIRTVPPFRPGGAAARLAFRIRERREFG